MSDNGTTFSLISLVLLKVSFISFRSFFSFLTFSRSMNYWVILSSTLTSMKSAFKFPLLGDPDSHPFCFDLFSLFSSSSSATCCPVRYSRQHICKSWDGQNLKCMSLKFSYALVKATSSSSWLIVGEFIPLSSCKASKHRFSQLSDCFKANFQSCLLSLEAHSRRNDLLFSV